ncbi:MAG TPA: PEP/pyruvate-binding domain-containing protein, partial [Candidatus Limnocylindrales bacterium]|nr:PEP/pyruvate-binding domain-containing protein [Candidatus Limnocylindrales bacterium]
MAIPLLVRLAEVRASDTELVGGKAANLGELIAAGFDVPDGFVLTTAAYRSAARAAKVDPAAPDEAGKRLRTSPVPPRIAAAAKKAYAALGGGKVAVRSSATAEDLPGASFAGQQDTYLDIEGDDALLDAIRRCWASLWNERAVAYRAANGIDDGSVALAVVVQRMVEARAAGVLFTADPITGRRRTTVIDAAPGLGEALVSGAIVPDHYVADTASGRITERTVRGDRPVLSDRLVRELAGVGRRIEAALGSPQDIEFAIDADDRVWIVQSRPITTLYPLPMGGREDAVYFSISVAQGYFDPITPMGMEAFLAIGRRVAITFAGRASGGTVPNAVVAAGERPFVDVAPVLRDRLGSEVLARLTTVGEARSSVVFRKLAADPRFRPKRRLPFATLRRIVPLMLRSGIPMDVLRLIESPAKARARILRRVEAMTRVDVRADMTAAERLDLVEDLMDRVLPSMFPRLIGLVAAGMLSYVAAGRLLGDRATPAELLTVTRGLPNNPTTEMDLALWAVANEIRSDPASRDLILGRSAGEVAAAFRAGTAPPVLQTNLARFLERYGFRAVGEIDLGVPRWSEDPTHLVGAIANYLKLTDDALAPDAQFQRGAQEAEAMI